MVIDVIQTVAVVAAALGAISELQMGMLRIGTPADCAFVAVQRLGCLLLIVLCPVGIGALCSAVSTVWLHKVRQDIDDIASKENEVVEQGEDREEVQPYRIIDRHGKIEPCQIFHLQRDDEEQQHLIFRIQGGKRQQQTQIQ